VGARKSVKVDFRLISASNRDLAELVRSGRFREDLYYRLHIFPIMVPPLRDRIEDIPELVRRFALRFAAEEGKRVRAVSAEAIRLLCGYRWPGNVRQLENAVFRAVVLAESDEIGVAEFPQIAAQVPGYEGQVPPPPGPLVAGAVEPILLDQSPATTPATDAFLAGDGHVRPLEELEAEAIRFAIARYDGRMTEVARRLKIGRSTLYRKLKELGLEAEAEGAPAEASEADVAAG
jgi:DNA-binding NtrC family response regulator